MSPDEDAHRVASMWHEKALADLEAAKVCLESDKVPAWITGFHLQQAVEKGMKGLMVFSGSEPPPTHDLTRLHQLLTLAGRSHPMSPEELQQLQPFAVNERYPILSPDSTTREEVLSLIAPAERLVEHLAATFRK